MVAASGHPSWLPPGGSCQTALRNRLTDEGRRTVGQEMQLDEWQMFRFSPFNGESKTFSYRCPSSVFFANRFRSADCQKIQLPLGGSQGIVAFGFYHSTRYSVPSGCVRLIAAPTGRFWSSAFGQRHTEAGDGDTSAENPGLHALAKQNPQPEAEQTAAV